MSIYCGIRAHWSSLCHSFKIAILSNHTFCFIKDMCAIRYKTGCCVGVGGRACHLTCVLGSVPLKDFGPPLSKVFKTQNCTGCNFVFQIQGVRNLQSLEVGIFLESSSCELFKNVRNLLSSIFSLWDSTWFVKWYFLRWKFYQT